MADLPQQAVYEDDPRTDVEPHLPAGFASVLDVGCGPGGFGPTLRRHVATGGRVVGVEAVPENAAAAHLGHGFDEVVQGYFPQALAGSDERFDLITFNDVLEHVVDPWRTLEDCHDLLTPGGRVIAAIPSIRYAPVAWRLVLRGDWTYTDTGTLDRTHVRFFTRSSMVEMFERAGFEVETCAGANGLGERWATDPLLPRRLAKLGLARALGDAAYLHFVVVGRSTRGGG